MDVPNGKMGANLENLSKYKLHRPSNAIYRYISETDKLLGI